MLSKTSSAQCDSLVEEQFHAYIGVDLDGPVISDPLVEPAQLNGSGAGEDVRASKVTGAAHYTKACTTAR